MTKIKVEIDKEDASPETIRKYKNYGGFIEGYHKFHTQKGIRDLWYRNKRLMAWIAIIVSLLLISIFAAVEEEEKAEKEKEKVESSK